MLMDLIWFELVVLRLEEDPLDIGATDALFSWYLS